MNSGRSHTRSISAPLSTKRSACGELPSRNLKPLRRVTLQQFIEWPLRLSRQVQQPLMDGRRHIGQVALLHDRFIPELQDTGA
jgi:hypothetical protein